jgi:glycosyltransferase involved in cell wall biosynthesis
MKISICIPQYNRISLLEKSLRMIESQTYENLEIVVSDDGSTDDTEARILALQPKYKYPLVFSRSAQNQGYDRNYRRCIELATGDYCLVIGNDDSLNEPDAMAFLADFLKKNDYPEIGFSNFVEDNDREFVVERASGTRVIGKGPEVALRHYNGFSFVGGLIYKKSAFDQYNTGKHDGSIYSQMYLGLLMIASGCRLFTIQKPLIIKDIHFDDGSFRWSYYRDGLPKSWKEYKVMDGGMPSVATVLTSAVEDATGAAQPHMVYQILRRIYLMTLPYWIIQYKKHGSFAAAMGLVRGMSPTRVAIFKKANAWGKIRLWAIYLTASTAALLLPTGLFGRLEKFIYKSTRRS